MEIPNSTPSRDLPAPDAIREKISEVLARPDFQIDPVTTEQSWEWLKLFFLIVRWILKPFVWLMELTEGLPMLLRWTIIVALLVVTVLLVWHITHTIVAAIRGPQRLPRLPESEEPSQRNPEIFEQRADEAARHGAWIDAIRLLFRATLLRLEAREKRRFRVGMTNREHLRRYRQSPIAEPFRQFVETLDLKWYGDEPCDRSDYDSCLEAHTTIRHFARRVADVHTS